MQPILKKRRRKDMNIQMILLIVGAILLVGGAIIGVYTDDLSGVWKNTHRRVLVRKINDTSVDVAAIGILLLLASLILWLSALLHVGAWFWFFLLGGALVLIDLRVAASRAVHGFRRNRNNRVKTNEEVKNPHEVGPAVVGLFIIAIGIICFVVGL
jgi:hypothetical protein